MKRVLACICGWILLCGIHLTVWGNTPLYSKEYTVSQPSGETFRVQIRIGYNPPFEAGTQGMVEVNNKNNRYYYDVRLAEDGYWYYTKCNRITVIPLDNPNATFIVTNEEDWKSEYSDLMKYDTIKEFANEAKYLIDPLPQIIYKTSAINANKYCPDEEEKETMAEMIAAERRRLGKEELTTTGEEPVESVISDPGPELFITVPVEGTESQPAAVTEQPAEVTSEPAQTEHREETETQSAPETTTAREPSEPAVTAAAEEENTGRWTGPLLWGGGILVLIGLGAGGGVLLWRRKKKRGA